LTRVERYRHTQRLRGAAINQILAVTRPRRSGSVSVRIKANGLGYARLGLIVAKRILPRAVDRNRARRLIREWFRRRQAAVPAQDLLVRLTNRPMPLASVIADLERVFSCER
jgi:ribonuclease P protein component